MSSSNWPQILPLLPFVISGYALWVAIKAKELNDRAMRLRLFEEVLDKLGEKKEMSPEDFKVILAKASVVLSKGGFETFKSALARGNDYPDDLVYQRGKSDWALTVDRVSRALSINNSEAKE